MGETERRCRMHKRVTGITDEGKTKRATLDTGATVSAGSWTALIKAIRAEVAGAECAGDLLADDPSTDAPPAKTRERPIANRTAVQAVAYCRWTGRRL
jgi:hypothetical protein